MYNVLNETDYYPRNKHSTPHSPIPDVVYCKYCGERPARIFEGVVGEAVLYFCSEAHYKQYKLEAKGE